jgi:osmotically-inducible protein OsmY
MVRIRRLAGAGSFLLFLTLTACGESSVEEQLVRAEGVLRDARGAVRQATEKVDQEEQELEVVQAELREARRELSEAEARLADAESKVDLKTTDDLVFRSLQRRLLEEDELDHVALRVEVNRGVVTVRGTVPEAESRDLALEIAGEFPGVASVNDQITVSEKAEAP